jgi:hypothetical protein
MAGAGLDGVDLWVGFGGTEHVHQVVQTLRPQRVVPHHWDDFWTPLADGPGRTFPGDALARVLGPAGVRLLVPTNYFDRLILTPDSAWIEDGSAVRRSLGRSGASGAPG